MQDLNTGCQFNAVGKNPLNFAVEMENHLPALQGGLSLFSVEGGTCRKNPFVGLNEMNTCTAIEQIRQLAGQLNPCGSRTGNDDRGVIAAALALLARRLAGGARELTPEIGRRPRRS